MIAFPVKYTQDSKRIVDLYKSNKDTQASIYWYNPDIENLKAEVKEHYKNVQNLTCVYCNKQYSIQHSAVWDVEHIVARANSPQFMFTPENLCVACKDCNVNKGDKNVLINKKRKTYPKKSADFIILHPHFDRYNEHIAIYMGKIYSAKTEKGRQTIEVCGLLRFSFQSVGWDSSVSQMPDILDVAQNLLNADNHLEQQRLMMELLMSAQIQISNTLKIVKK